LAQLDFFALDEDVEDVLRFVYDQTDCRMFESRSRPGRSIREFPSLQLLLDSDHRDVNHGRFNLRFFSPAANFEPTFREIVLTETGKIKTIFDGVPVYQIVQGGYLDTEDDVLRWSTFSHWNEAGAKQRSTIPDEVLEQVDWKALRRVSGQIQRHIKNRLAVAKVRTRPVLSHAYSSMADGLRLFGGPGIVDSSSSRLEVLEN